MENKKIEHAKEHLMKSEADLKIAKAAEESAEREIDAALQEMKEAGEHHLDKTHFEIQIDRKHYKVESKEMTGAQLRVLPSPPIGPDRDLFKVVPGGNDLKIGNDDIVRMENGLRFFSAPAQINPGIKS